MTLCGLKYDNLTLGTDELHGDISKDLKIVFKCLICILCVYKQVYMYIYTVTEIDKSFSINSSNWVCLGGKNDCTTCIFKRKPKVQRRIFYLFIYSEFYEIK